MRHNFLKKHPQLLAFLIAQTDEEKEAAYRELTQVRYHNVLEGYPNSTLSLLSICVLLYARKHVYFLVEKKGAKLFEKNAQALRLATQSTDKKILEWLTKYAIENYFKDYIFYFAGELKKRVRKNQLRSLQFLMQKRIVQLAAIENIESLLTCAMQYNSYCVARYLVTFANRIKKGLTTKGQSYLNDAVKKVFIAADKKNNTVMALILLQHSFVLNYAISCYNQYPDVIQLFVKKEVVLMSSPVKKDRESQIAQLNALCTQNTDDAHQKLLNRLKSKDIQALLIKNNQFIALLNKAQDHNNLIAVKLLLFIPAIRRYVIQNKKEFSIDTKGCAKKLQGNINFKIHQAAQDAFMVLPQLAKKRQKIISALYTLCRNDDADFLKEMQNSTSPLYKALDYQQKRRGEQFAEFTRYLYEKNMSSYLFHANSFNQVMTVVQSCQIENLSLEEIVGFAEEEIEERDVHDAAQVLGKK